MGQAVIIGANGIICMYGMKLLDMLKIDDVVGAVSTSTLVCRNMGYPSCRLDKTQMHHWLHSS